MEKSFKEQRIRKITDLYYSRPEIQKAIYEFSKNREISPRYFEGFGKRPDILEYPNDVSQLAKKGATSFHCSEEIWSDPLKIETGMPEKQLNEIREGWDLLIDLDCKWFDYSKLAAQAIVKTFSNHGIKNIGVKFSGSKGFHIILPWKAFPKEINDLKTKDLFPEVPRKLAAYLRFQSEKFMKEFLPEDFYDQFKDVEIKRGYKCKKCGAMATATKEVEFNCPFCKITEIKKFPEDNEIPETKCYKCKREIEPKILRTKLSCDKCHQWKEGFAETKDIDLYELMGLDLVLVSPRHLFRTPYSLHEKTALSSVVIDSEKIMDFEIKDADPIKIKVKNFLPDSVEGEAKEFVMQALDWYKENNYESNDVKRGKYADFKPVKLVNLTEEQFSDSIKKILEGVSDGRKRALFVLLNFFRSIGMEKDDLEKKIYEWNKKNEVPLKQGYITSQLIWSYKRKPIMPPNFNTDFYKGIGIIPTEQEIRAKNPVSYTIKRNFASNNSSRKKTKS